MQAHAESICVVVWRDLNKANRQDKTTTSAFFLTDLFSALVWLSKHCSGESFCENCTAHCAFRYCLTAHFATFLSDLVSPTTACKNLKDRMMLCVCILILPQVVQCSRTTLPLPHEFTHLWRSFGETLLCIPALTEAQFMCTRNSTFSVISTPRLSTAEHLWCSRMQRSRMQRSRMQSRHIYFT